MKRAKGRLHKVIIIGATPSGIAAANKLGELGIPVCLVDPSPDLDGKLAEERWRTPSGVPFNFAHRSGLLRILRNPSAVCHLPAAVEQIKHTPQGFAVRIRKAPEYVDRERCTLCGRCVEVCPVVDHEGRTPLVLSSRRALPGRPVLEKRNRPLCQESCPLGVNAQAYMALTRQGRYAEALAVVRRDNALPGVCGRVCNHPCESACRRGEVDESVAIRDVKRFLADWELKSGNAASWAVSAPNGKKAAVVGSGPAGLAAAADLARLGYAVTVFEKEERPGGMLRYGIGPHRLPREILDREIEQIAGLGVAFQCGKDILESNGLSRIQGIFDAAVLATGCWKDRKTGVPGEDLEGVFGCVEYLSRFHRGDAPPVKGKTAAVVGDGNAAFDLARTLFRAGVRVTLLSWFPADMLPADPEEVDGAREEGIAIVCSRRVKEFLGENGRLKALRLVPTRPGEPDAKGIPWPKDVPGGAADDAAFDLAFVAIGQAGPYSEESGPGVAVTDKGLLGEDGAGRTSLAKVYAAGDAATGPSTVVSAMASGRRAAAALHADLAGARRPGRSTRPVDRDFLPIAPGLPTRPRAGMPETRPRARANSFGEVALGYTEAQAASEAERCLACGACSECLLCEEACAAVGAIDHAAQAEEITEQAGVVILADPALAPSIKGEDVLRAYPKNAQEAGVYAHLSRGFAAAAQAMVLLSSTSSRIRGYGMPQTAPDPGLDPEIRVGVFACRCNDSLGWHDGLSGFVAGLPGSDGVVHAETLPAACTAEGAAYIVRAIRQKDITRVVLASCVCCPLNFICSACTDQRTRLKDALFRGTGVSRAMVECVNIRGEALSLLREAPETATARFEGLINRAVSGAAHLRPFANIVRSHHFTAAAIGQSEAVRSAALTLAQAGHDVFVFGDNTAPPDDLAHPNIQWFGGSRVRSISGSVGNFRLTVETGAGVKALTAGAVILGQEASRRVPYTPQDGLPPRGVTETVQRPGVPGIPYLLPGRTSISGLFLASPPGVVLSERAKGAAAAVLTAAAMPRGPRQQKGYTVAVDAERCRGCGACASACPFTAVTLRPNGMGGYCAHVDEAFCKGCGNCISVCPSGAADSPYRDQAFLEQRLGEILQG
jgi:NADPH-dependent glutamate synthase beta subunit-like oxidoreductase/NAD-dependent dihydropyrimidine dehydrogenase PreA subunit